MKKFCIIAEKFLYIYPSGESHVINQTINVWEKQVQH